MYDTSITAPPTLTPEKPKTPVWGILSCAAALVSVLLVCGLFFLAYSVGSQHPSLNQVNYQQLAGLGYGMLALICGSGIASLIGIALGIVAVVQKGSGRVWGIVGIALNALIMLGFCFLFSLGFLASRSVS